MSNQIQSAELARLIPHPDNPNRMSRANFKRLLENMARTGRYEPLVVRPAPGRPGFLQILNGHHRCQALKTLGHKTADVVVWDVDDHQADILLATLNRLAGSDELARKLRLLKRMNTKLNPVELSKLIPRTARQIERLAEFRAPTAPARVPPDKMLNPMVFFVNLAQQKTIDTALASALNADDGLSRAAREAAALTRIAGQFLADAP